MYDRLLVPTDGSAEMGQVLAHATDLADKYDADLKLLYVVDTRLFVPVPDDSEQSIRQAMIHEGKEAVQTLANQVDDDVSIQADIAEGIPHKAIGQYVVDRDVDLVVMGTNGRTGSERQAIGSVAERTVQAASVPVHVVPLESEGADELEDSPAFH